MEKNTHSLNWLALGAELINCLRSKGNHRLTRYDAFVWMMEHIQKGVAVRDADGVCRKLGTLFRFLQTPCGRLELGASYRSIIHRRTYGFVGHHF